MRSCLSFDSKAGSPCFSYHVAWRLGKRRARMVRGKRGKERRRMAEANSATKGVAGLTVFWAPPYFAALLS